MLAAFATTPFSCLGLRVARLRTPTELDLVVEAVGLAARCRSAVEGTVVLPPRLPDMSWTSPLPPRSGWKVVATTTRREALHRLRTDTDEFTRLASEVQPGRGANAALEGLATQLWSRPWRDDAPARLVHAAEYLGFLDAPHAPDEKDDGQVTLRRAGAWRRLDTPLGVTAARVSDPLGIFVS